MLPSSFSTPLFFLSNSQIVNLTDDNDEPLLCLFFLIKTNPQVRNEAEIGLGLTGFGVLFSFLGIIFFFDKGFLAMGNVSAGLFFHSFLCYFFFISYFRLILLINTMPALTTDLFFVTLVRSSSCQE